MGSIQTTMITLMTVTQSRRGIVNSKLMTIWKMDMMTMSLLAISMASNMLKSKEGAKETRQQSTNLWRKCKRWMLEGSTMRQITMKTPKMTMIGAKRHKVTIELEARV